MVEDPRVVLITGGTRGIGLATATRFAQLGYRVAVTHVRHRQSADAAVSQLQQVGDVMLFKADVRRPEAMKEVAEAIAHQWGRVDVAIHNAASGVAKPLSEVTQHHFEFTMGTNAWGLVSLAQAVAPMMPAGGSIVGIGSLGSVRAYQNYGLVGASKAALEALARHLARDYGPAGIRVNVVSAGPIDTDALHAFSNREDMLNEFVARNPLRQALDASDVAEAVVFVAQQRMVNGQVLVVDGGYLAMA